jgi:hypothetical protein
MECCVEVWEAHEKHDKETTAILNELGFVDTKGRIRRFVGELFWPRMDKAQHTSLDFHKCACKQKVEQPD